MAELIPVAASARRSKASVIFVHGLSGHAFKTWGASETSREKFWPAWLAEERRLSGLSVFTLSYEADSSELFGTAMSLFDHGENILATLLAEPSLCSGPIAFVAHSLGGLVVKQVLREAFEQRERDPAARRFLDQVAQVCFIATPHQGSRLPVLIDRWGWFAWRPTIVMKSLRDGDEGLLKLKRWYTNFCGADPGRIRHLVFRETQRTNRFMVVTEASADPGVPAEQFPVAASHIDIAKPSSRGAEVYRRVRDSLEELLAERRAPGQPRIVPASARRLTPGLSRGRILHREVREVPDLAARLDMDQALDIAFGRNPAHPIALTNSGQVTRSVAGMAGVGKTELARSFAWRNRDAYDGVWWIAAETREGTMQGLAELGERFAPEIGAIPQLDKAAEETIARIESSSAERPFLIVFDNVPSPADLDGLVPRTRSHILITSRWSDWFGTAEKLDVGLFTEEQAVEHLTRASADKDREGAVRLARDLGFLPLAIDHAASYRRSRRARSFDDYRERLSELIHAEPGPRARAHLYPMSVHRTFTLALEQMSNEHRAPVEIVMAMAAFMAPEAIPVSVLGLDVLPGEARDTALATLAEVSLISFTASGTNEPMFTVHRLVQLVMLDRLEENGRAAEMLELAINAIDRAVPRTAFEFAGWPVTRPLVPHARSVLAHARSVDYRGEVVARLAVKIGQFLVATGSVAGVEELLQLAIEIYEEEQGTGSNAVGVALMTLAQAYGSQGRYAEADPLLRRDLAITAESLGTDHPQYAATLATLAQLHVAQDRQADAEPLLEQALGIDEQVLGADHPETLSVLGSLAGVYVAQGRYAAAEPLLRRALTVTERVSGAVHPDTAAASGRLAELFVTLGRYAEAALLLERDLAIAEELLGVETPDTSVALTSLAQLFVTLGQYERAEPLYQRALAIREALTGRQSLLTATTLHGLGWLRANQGRYAEADDLYSRALAIREAAVGEEHMATATTINAMGQLRIHQGRYAEAETLLIRDRDITERLIGPRHPDRAGTLTSLGQLYVYRDRYGDADALLDQALAIRQDAFGSDHPATATTLAALAWLRAHQGCLREAAALYDRALDVRMRKLGPSHPWVARTLGGMAELALREGNLMRADELNGRALDIRREVLPAAHPDISQCHWISARVLAGHGHNEEAKGLLRQALDLLEPAVVAEHVLRARIEEMLSQLH